MRLDDRASDRQAETGRAVRARGAGAALDERLEDPHAVFRRDSLAAVGNLELDLARPGLGTDDDAAVGRRVANRVLDQVEEDALEALGIRACRSQVAGHLNAD